jgi:hypothetical protein
MEGERKRWLTPVLLAVGVAAVVWCCYAACIAPVYAGDIGLFIGPSTDQRVTHARFYADGVLVNTSAVGDLVPPTEPFPSWYADKPDHKGVVLTDAPNNCTQRTYTVRFAFQNASGWVESADSNSVPSMARPFVNEAIVTGTGIRQITGENFVVGTAVKDDTGEILPTTYRGCQVLEIPETPTGSVTVIVPGDLKPYVFNLPISPPNTMIN